MTVTGLPDWVAAYIGLPYAMRGDNPASGIDCYQLVRLVLREQFAIDAPDYRGEYGVDSSHGHVARLLRRYAPGWVSILAGQEQPGDVVLLIRRGLPLHCGLVIAPGWMLHTEAECDSVVEPYRDATAWGRQQPAFYRWPRGAGA